ncbi:MAG: hypothetical protein ACI39Q_00655 [Wujia sp.]
MNSNNYKNRLFGFTLTTTIIDGMISLGLVFMVGFAFFLMSESSELIGESADMVSNAREHNLTGGYEMMFGMGGGFVGFMGSIIGMVMLSVTIFLLVLMLIITIHGVIVCVKASKRFVIDKNKYVKAYKRDSIVKIIIHGLFAFIVFASVFTVDSPSVMAILIGCLLIIVLGFSVANLITVRYI